MKRDERPVARRRKALRLADQLLRSATVTLAVPVPAGGRRDTAPRRSFAPPSPSRGLRRYGPDGAPQLPGVHLRMFPRVNKTKIPDNYTEPSSPYNTNLSITLVQVIEMDFFHS